MKFFLYLDTGDGLRRARMGKRVILSVLARKKEKSELSVVKLKLFFGQRGDKFGELKYYL